MAVATTNLGVITAYGDAVAAGYTGSKAQWQALMASYGEVVPKMADMTGDLDAIQTATASDVGKYLKTKTVEGGKVTNWEFSDVGTDIALSIVNGQLCMTYSE